MSGEPEEVLSEFIPPPLDGLNLIASPTEYLPTEAKVLDNYLVYDTGIREVRIPTIAYNGSGSVDFQFPYYDSSNVAKILFSLGTSIYRYNIGDGTATDVTGGSAISSGLWFPCYFNRRIFLFNGVDVPRYHDLGSGAVADTGFSGVTQSELIQATAYKKRLYIVQNGTRSFWYGAVDAIAGALTEFNLSSIFDYPGNLLCVFNWTYNQGLQNEELFVALSDQGEFVIYSGDYPAAANWQLVAKGRMPAVVNNLARQAFVKVANDVNIVTNRGVISLSALVSGNTSEASYFTVSRKIKNNVVTGLIPALDNFNPFVYFVGSDMSQLTSVYVLNYERGAWSRLYFPNGLGNTMKSISAFNGVIRIGTTDGDLYELDISLQTTSDTTHVWQTPYLNFKSNQQKVSKSIRVIGLNYGANGNFINSCSISSNFANPATAIPSGDTTAVTADVNTIQELAPPGIGRWLSYKFSKAGVSSANQKNEIQGFEAMYEMGGMY